MNERGGPSSGANQMHFGPDLHGILWPGSKRQGSTHGSHEALHGTKLGTPKISKSSPMIHWILQLLQEILPKLFSSHLTFTWSNQERGVIFREETAGWHVHQVKRNLPVSPGHPHARNFQTFPRYDWCLPHHFRRSPYASKLQWGPPPLHLSLSNLLPHKMKLWHIWLGTPHCPSYTKGMVTLPYLDCSPSHHHHWS